jgi:hypothetical protein|tara:strand:+ start:3074 stop:3211 length:138 start_codon:yes stop_codon:yes gene_type:complete
MSNIRAIDIEELGITLRSAIMENRLEIMNLHDTVKKILKEMKKNE